MHLFIVRRLLSTVPVLMFVAVFAFLILRLTPGDPAALIVGDMGTEADIARVRQHLKLDGPLTSQLLQWFTEVLSGNLGESYYLKKSVAELIAQRLEPTLSLAAFTIVIAGKLASDRSHPAPACDVATSALLLPVDPVHVMNVEIARDR